MDNNSFGMVLKSFREDAGYTRAQLGRMSGLDPTFLKRIEDEGSAPSRESINDIAQALHLTADQHDLLLILRGFTPNDLHLMTVHPDLVRLNIALTRMRERDSMSTAAVEVAIHGIEFMAEAILDLEGTDVG